MENDFGFSNLDFSNQEQTFCDTSTKSCNNIDVTEARNSIYRAVAYLNAITPPNFHYRSERDENANYLLRLSYQLG